MTKISRKSVSRKRVPFLICIGLLLMASEVCAVKKDPYPPPTPPFHVLVEAGQARSVVVLPKEPSAIESHAAKELVDYVKRITGAQVTTADSAPDGLYPIYLGRSAKERLGQVDWQSLGTDGFVLRSTPDGMLIAGAEDLGTLYAVYQLLEKHMGVRWFMPGELGEVVPQSRTLRVGTFSETEIPSFRVRWVERGEWALRNKMNVRVKVGDDEVGIRWKWGFHTHFYLIPPDKYYGDHPEWFALIKGERVRPKPKQQGRQLCTSNPEVVAEMAKNMIKVFDEDPSLDILALAPQDGGGFCECEQCRALDEDRPPEQAWHARYSNRLAVFNNKVAALVAEKHPDKLIKVGAYAMYLRVPLDPNYRPAPNLAVQVCHTYSCNNHRIAPPSCTRNHKYFTPELEHWSKIAKHLFIYEYYNKGAWGGLPYHQVHVIREDMPYYHKLGAESFYTQPAGRRWSAVGLNHYIAAKLAWDVELDVDRLMEDFCEKFYGEAADPMRRYWQTLERIFAETDQCLAPFGLRWTTLCATDFFTPERLAELDAAVGDAEQRARSKTVKERVHLARVMVDFTKKVMHYLATIRKPFQGIDLKDAKAVRRACKQATALGEPLSAELKVFCKEHGVPAYERLIAVHKQPRMIAEFPDRRIILR